MTRPALVELDARALEAHGLSRRDVSHAPVGTVIVAGDGTQLRVTPEGALDPVESFGRRSIASDPAARSAR